MGKKESSGLGRSLRRKKNVIIKFSHRHSSDLPDGREFNCLNLRSITEINSVDDFLSKASLAELEFNSEFSNIKLIENNPFNLTLSEVQGEKIEALCIPRRPSWDLNTSKYELEAKEREVFLSWRRELAMIEERDLINVTPFEKNIEVWKQLWRVIEKSNVIIQVLDARNPLLFRCIDLEKYVKEVNQNKVNMLLLNKADLLTESQRQSWRDYFESNGIQILFFSALQQLERTENQETSVTVDKSKARLSSREELIQFLNEIRTQYFSQEELFTVGFVGYPNVGKSAAINALLLSKKVSSSSTPGKTKHFQTFIINGDLCICDCPGLVFPNLLSSKAEMIVNGILPVDQLKEWRLPISLIINFVPQNVLECVYSLSLSSSEKEDEVLTADDFLNAYGYSRGFMTKRGLPDCARAARDILKDFHFGKLLHCVAPPNIEQDSFNEFIIKPKKIYGISKEQKSAEAYMKVKKNSKTHDCDPKKKIWKKHNNKNKKEKLKRIFQPYD